MPFAITHMPGEPILIVRIEIPLDQHLPSATSVFSQLAHLARTSSAGLFILIDLRGQAPLFSDVLIGMQFFSELESGSEQHSARLVLVGSDPMLRIAVKRIKRQFGLDVVRFDTLEHALAYARAENARTDRLDEE
jgi:hypothetical protein